MSIRAVIDQKAFEDLVSGKAVKLQGVSRENVPYGEVDVELILSDIGFAAMIGVIRNAVLVEHDPSTNFRVVCLDVLEKLEGGEYYDGAHPVVAEAITTLREALKL